MKSTTWKGMALAALVIAAAGCPEETAETCAVWGERPECSLPQFSLEPEGAAEAPALDELLADETPEASASLTVEAGENELTLADGFRLVLPAGSLSVGATVDVSRFPYTGAPGERMKWLYRVVASEQPAAPVSLTFPLPGDQAQISDETSGVWWFHENDAPEALSGEVDQGAATVTVTASAFSVFAPFNQFPVPTPLPSTRIIRTPFYAQGETSNCWCSALTMLLAGYGADVEIWDSNAYFKIDEKQGLPWQTFAESPGFARYVEEKLKAKLPGARAERMVWWLTTSAQVDAFRNYLTTKIAAGHPVQVFFPGSGHMVLFVGIDKGEYLIHDPAKTPYKRESWSTIESTRISDWLTFDKAATLTIDQPMPPYQPTASLGIPFASSVEGLTFKNGESPAQLIGFSWYSAALGRQGLVRVSDQKPRNPSLEHTFFARVAATNLRHDIPEKAPFALGFEIVDANGAVVHRQPEQVVKIGGGGNLSMIDLAVASPVREMVDAPGAYRAVFYISQDGARQDTAEIPFDVEGAAVDAGIVDRGQADLPEEPMISVPAGSFTMGCNKAREEPVIGTSLCDATRVEHEVQLDAFEIDRLEVTAGAYGACVAAGACTAPVKATSGCNHEKPGRENHPINCIDWQQAQAYCQWRGKRLPTEAEWEMAARGSDGRLYPWGDEVASCERANLQDDPCPNSTLPVGSKPAGASPFGVEDMIGNVGEWVADWYADDYYASSPQQNPQGPASGTERVHRGGAFYYDVTNMLNESLASQRMSAEPDKASSARGVRCARTP